MKIPKVSNDRVVSIINSILIKMVNLCGQIKSLVFLTLM